jgi:hypothetical protein
MILKEEYFLAKLQHIKILFEFMEIFIVLWAEL